MEFREGVLFICTLIENTEITLKYENRNEIVRNMGSGYDIFSQNIEIGSEKLQIPSDWGLLEPALFASNMPIQICMHPGAYLKIWL